jgi:thiamine pyrophosphate-dependent acetolactate synthase large subunit-like protein
MSTRDPIGDALDRLTRARRPLILLGLEAAPALEQLLGLASALGACVLTTPDALSLVAGARSNGVFSFGASARARRAVEASDVVLAASALGEFASRMGSAFDHHVLIQMVESVSDAQCAREPDVLLTGPLVTGATRLLAALEGGSRLPREPWFCAEPVHDEVPSRPARSGTMHPRAAMQALRAGLPPGARLCLDVTSAALHAYAQVATGAGDRVFSSIERSACMGEALLASLGIRLASGAPTLALVGDWGFCMAPHELHTAVELGLSRYVVVVWSNGGGAFIGAGVAQQGLRVPDRAWRWRTPVDFASLAEGFGARGLVVSEVGALEHAVTAGLAGDRPVLIDAQIDPEAAVPAGDRFLTLGIERS